MKILGIDTTKKSAKIFIVDTKQQEKSCFVELSAGIKHSEGLFLHIEKVLLDCRLTIKDIDGFVCVVGPGSFTGIRVGMSTIKGLNKVLNKSVISLNTFEVLSTVMKNGIILLNSTNTSCYYAKINKSQIVETGVVDKKDVLSFAGNTEIIVLKEEQDVINIEYNNYKIIEDLDSLYFDSVVKKMNSGDYGEFVPYYLQLSQAERNIL